MKSFAKRRRQRSGNSFNPSHDDINKAIADFQSQGGQIHKMEATDENLQNFIAASTANYADEFLMGK